MDTQNAEHITDVQELATSYKNGEITLREFMRDLMGLHMSLASIAQDKNALSVFSEMWIAYIHNDKINVPE